METKTFLKIGLFSIALLSLLSLVSAWGAYIPDTWNSNQLYAGSYFVPSSPYAGWTYNAYFPSNGYPLQGGSRFYPNGYFSSGYVGPVYHYGYGSYTGYPYSTAYAYGVPIHTTSDSFYRCSAYYGC